MRGPIASSVVLLALAAGQALAQEPPLSPGHRTDPPVAAPAGAPGDAAPCALAPAVPITEFVAPQRRPLESDRAFDGFIGPITNPLLAKDPRSLTEVRVLGIHNVIDPNNPLGGGNFQAVAAQVRLALTERLTFFADGDGYAWIHPGNGGNQEGWLNTAAGLRYLFVRDVENQFLWSGGLMYMLPSGEKDAFSGHGGGLFTVFTTAAQEFDGCSHLLGTVGYQFPADQAQNSSFFYASLHVDRQLFGWLYPLAELNWYHYTDGGSRGLPSALGEGDGLLNLGTSGVNGNDLVTAAVGLTARLNRHAQVGAAWEFPISNRHDLINNRLTVEFILRY